MYPNDQTDWTRITGTPCFDYPIDSQVAVLHVDEITGRIDFVSRREPDSYCHYHHHRHIGETSLLVLKGEHHVVESKHHETVHKIRTPGFFATNPGGDVSWCRARVANKRIDEDARLVDLELQVDNQLGETTATGTAVIELPHTRVNR